MRTGCSRAECLRDPAHGSYLHLKSQELHEALMDAHETIGFQVEEKVEMRGAVPASSANDQQVALFTDQLAATAAFNAEWDAGQLRGQIGLV
jgi:hypothetical protein